MEEDYRVKYLKALIHQLKLNRENNVCDPILSQLHGLAGVLENQIEQDNKMTEELQAEINSLYN